MILPVIEFNETLTLAQVQSKIDNGDYNDTLQNYSFLIHCAEGIARVNKETRTAEIIGSAGNPGTNEKGIYFVSSTQEYNDVVSGAAEETVTIFLTKDITFGYGNGMSGINVAIRTLNIFGNKLCTGYTDINFQRPFGRTEFPPLTVNCLSPISSTNGLTFTATNATVNILSVYCMGATFRGTLEEDNLSYSACTWNLQYVNLRFGSELIIAAENQTLNRVNWYYQIETGNGGMPIDVESLFSGSGFETIPQMLSQEHSGLMQNAQSMAVRCLPDTDAEIESISFIETQNDNSVQCRLAIFNENLELLAQTGLFYMDTTGYRTMPLVDSAGNPVTVPVKNNRQCYLAIWVDRNNGFLIAGNNRAIGNLNVEKLKAVYWHSQIWGSTYPESGSVNGSTVFVPFLKANAKGGGTGVGAGGGCACENNILEINDSNYTSYLTLYDGEGGMGGVWYDLTIPADVDFVHIDLPLFNGSREQYICRIKPASGTFKKGKRITLTGNFALCQGGKMNSAGTERIPYMISSYYYTYNRMGSSASSYVHFRVEAFEDFVFWNNIWYSKGY